MSIVTIPKIHLLSEKVLDGIYRWTIVQATRDALSNREDQEAGFRDALDLCERFLDRKIKEDTEEYRAIFWFYFSTYAAINGSIVHAPTQDGRIEARRALAEWTEITRK